MIAIVPLLYIRVTLSPVIIRKQLPDLIISKTKLFIMGDIYNGIDFKIVETCKNTLLGYTIMATTAEGMVNDARKLRSIIADIVVKVPVTAEGLAAIKMLKAEGIPTLGTAVYGAAQGLLSALAGAEYVAPYVNRIDAQGGSGIQAVTDLHQLLKMHAPQAKVLAASFKTPRQALDCLLAGCESITLPLDVAQQMLNTPAVESAIEKFEHDWNAAFGTTHL